MKIQKKWGGRVGVRGWSGLGVVGFGGSGWWGQGGCEQRSEAFVKIEKKNGGDRVVGVGLVESGWM